MIQIVAMRPHHGREQEWIDALTACAGPTQQEPGCRTYALHRGADDPNLVVVVEHWASAAARDAHRRSPHALEIQSLARELLAEHTVTVLEGLPTGDPVRGVI